MRDEYRHGFIFPHERGDGGDVMTVHHFSSTGLIQNRVIGVIHSCHVGLTRTGVRLRVGERTDLRIRWPISQIQNRCLRIGRYVVATIPINAVRLEAGIFRRSTQRWNRWIGRIVLVESTDSGIVYTVKIHGEDWTLMGYGPVLGARQLSKPWDIVNVVVDPQRIALATVD